MPFTLSPCFWIFNHTLDSTKVQIHCFYLVLYPQWNSSVSLLWHDTINFELKLLWTQQSYWLGLIVSQWQVFCTSHRSEKGETKASYWLLKQISLCIFVSALCMSTRIQGAGIMVSSLSPLARKKNSVILSKDI